MLIQGFPQDDVLAQLRDDLRSALRDRGVSENLDRRYKIAAAHLTVMRFPNPQADWKRLLDFLRAHRQHRFWRNALPVVAIDLERLVRLRRRNPHAPGISA